MNDFKLDLIANTEAFTQGLSDARDQIAELGQEAIQTQKDTQKAFENTGGMEKFGKTMKDAFMFVAKAEIEVKRLKKAISAATDPKEIKALNEQWENTTTVIKQAESAFEGVESASKSLKGQIRENKEILAQMEEQGLETTEAFIQLQIATGKLQDQVNDTNERIKFFASDTRGLDSAIGIARAAAAGFAVAEGAAALFGAENENVQKALLKVNAAMAILNGLQELQAALQKSSAARIAIETVLRKAKIFVIGEEVVATNTLTVAQTAAATAAKVLRAALLATGVGAVLFLVTQLIAAVSAMSDFSEETEKATDIIKKQDEALEDLADRYKFLTDVRIADAKRLGANNGTLRQIEKEGLQEGLKLAEKDVKDKEDLYNQMTAGLQNILRTGSNDEIKAYIEQYQAAEEALKNSRNKRIGLLREFTLFVKDSQAESQKEEKEANEKFDKEELERIKAHQARVKAIIDTNNANRIAAMDDIQAKELAQLEENKRKELVEARKSGFDINLINAKFAKEKSDILLKYQKQEFDNQVAFSDLMEQLEKERDEEFIDSQFQFLDDLRSIRQLELDIEFESGNKSLIETRRIAAEKLKVEIEYQEARIKLLKETNSGGSNDVAIKTAELAVEQGKNKMAQLAREGDNSDFLIAVGLGNVTEEQLTQIKDNLSTVVNSIKSIFDDLYNNAIEKNRLTISTLDEQIQKVQENVEKQQELANEGRRNNLKQEQEHLAKLEAEKRAAVERDKKLQRQKLNIDAVTQASSLVTASAQLYQSTSSAGPAGVAIAIAAIAAMFAAFAVNQVTARQAIDRQTYKRGGLIGGKYHDADGWGGNRYVNDNGDEIYTEKGEYVINRQAVKKYLPLIQAINADQITGINKMLNGTGVGPLTQDRVEQLKNLKQGHAMNEIKYRVDMENKAGNKETREFKKAFENYVSRQESKSTVTYSGGWKIEKRGNRTIRTKIK